MILPQMKIYNKLFRVNNDFEKYFLSLVISESSIFSRFNEANTSIF